MGGKFLKDWEKDFIYLAFPLVISKDLSKFTGKGTTTISRLAANFNLKKVADFVDINQKYGDLITTKRASNRTKKAFWCECKCGLVMLKNVYDLFFCQAVMCGHQQSQIEQEIIQLFKIMSATKVAKQLCVSKYQVIQTINKYQLKIRGRNDGYSMNYRGYKDIGCKYWTHIKNGAHQRNLEFNITKEYIWDLYEKQDRKCALSSIPITFSKDYKKIHDTASIDRIDSNIGYIEGNVQVVHKDINQMKYWFPQEYFISLCKAVGNNFADESI